MFPFLNDGGPLTPQQILIRNMLERGKITPSEAAAMQQRQQPAPPVDVGTGPAYLPRFVGGAGGGAANYGLRPNPSALAPPSVPAGAGGRPITGAYTPAQPG